MENIEDKIIDMQHQLLLLQKQVEEQKKLEEDKQTVEYHLSQLKKIINEKKSRENNKNNPSTFKSYEIRRITLEKKKNDEIVPAIETILNAMEVMNDKINLLLQYV
jgi:hypothetical protein